MAFLKSFVLALSAVSAVTAAPMLEAREEGNAPAPMYSGTWDQFPGNETWLDFEQLWKLNKRIIKAQGEHRDWLYGAIKDQSLANGVTPNIILAITMQESHGDVSAKTTQSFESFSTSGAMQCMNCASGAEKEGVTEKTVYEMILGGIKHFVASRKPYGETNEPRSIYPGLRAYNSGPYAVNLKNLSDGMGATNNYVSDIARRLGGWVY